MDIQPRRKKPGFEIIDAVTQPFHTSGGRAFAFRLAGWMGFFYFLLSAITYPVFMKANPALLAAAGDSDATMAALGPILWLYPFMIIYALLLGASAETALHKKLLFDEEHPRLPLRLGGTELKVMAVQFAYWLLVSLVYILMVFLSAGLGAALVGASGGPSDANPVLVGVIVLIFIVLIFAALFWVLVRFSPAVALTVWRDKMHVFAAGKITKFRYWNTFLAYLLAFMVGYMILSMLYAGIGAVFMGGFGNYVQTMGLPGADATEAYAQLQANLSNPVMMVVGLVFLAATSFATALWMLCMAGIANYVLQRWRDSDPAGQFD